MSQINFKSSIINYSIEYKIFKHHDSFIAQGTIRADSFVIDIGHNYLQRDNLYKLETTTVRGPKVIVHFISLCHFNRAFWKHT